MADNTHLRFNGQVGDLPYLLLYENNTPWDETIGTPAFVTYALADYDNYCNNLAQLTDSTRTWIFDITSLNGAGTLPAGLYTATVMLQDSATASTYSEANDNYMGAIQFSWDGSKIMGIADATGSRAGGLF